MLQHNAVLRYLKDQDVINKLISNMTIEQRIMVGTSLAYGKTNLSLCDGCGYMYEDCYDEDDDLYDDDICFLCDEQNMCPNCRYYVDYDLHRDVMICKPCHEKVKASKPNKICKECQDGNDIVSLYTTCRVCRTSYCVHNTPYWLRFDNNHSTFRFSNFVCNKCCYHEKQNENNEVLVCDI